MKLYIKFALYLSVIAAGFGVRAGAYDDLFVAVIRDDVGSLKSLLTQGVDPNSRDPKGMPALIAVAQFGTERRPVPGASLRDPIMLTTSSRARNSASSG